MNNPNDYRVGDKVILKPKGLYDGTHAGQVVELEWRGEPNHWDYRIDTARGVESGCVSVSDILGHAFEWGQEVEVGNDGNTWMRAYFWAYVPGAKDTVRTAGRGVGFAQVWAYARPIRTPELIEIDGKKYDAKAVRERIAELKEVKE